MSVKPATVVRTERDLLGERELPIDVYWGVHTLRALENFPITGIPIGRHHELIVALAAVKQAVALANVELGELDAARGAAIVQACEEIRAGHLHDQFVVDVVQGGAGTSTNMNANEVIANRALELLGHPRGAYDVLHPNEHVNRGQSTNDVYPTAVRIALVVSAGRLERALAGLREAFAIKAVEFADAVKLGRTQLQDAVPMTLGQELRAYASTLAEDEQRLREAASLLLEVNLGGTAIGTCVTAHRELGGRACALLAELTGLAVVQAPDLVEATQDAGGLVWLSGTLKRIAVKLSKTCNDLRLLASGPRAGFGEIVLPSVQAGSSIMPGKVNPVIPEVVNQVAFAVIGGDVTVTMAAEGGQLQLNAFEPIIATTLLDGLDRLTAACDTLASRCVAGITADRELLRLRAEESIGLATALNPHVGYAAATEVVREALATGRGIGELALERRLLRAEQLAAILDAAALARGDS